MTRNVQDVDPVYHGSVLRQQIALVDSPVAEQLLDDRFTDNSEMDMDPNTSSTWTTLENSDSVGALSHFHRSLSDVSTPTQSTICECS